MRTRSADTKAADLGFGEGTRAPIVEPNRDPIASHLGPMIALEVVAGDGAAGRTDHRRGGAAEDLIAEHAAHHATGNCAGARTLRAGADRFDTDDTTGGGARRMTRRSRVGRPVGRGCDDAHRL